MAANCECHEIAVAEERLRFGKYGRSIDLILGLPRNLIRSRTAPTNVDPDCIPRSGSMSQQKEKVMTHPAFDLPCPARIYEAVVEMREYCDKLEQRLGRLRDEMNRMQAEITAIREELPRDNKSNEE